MSRFINLSDAFLSISLMIVEEEVSIKCGLAAINLKSKSHESVMLQNLWPNALGLDACHLH